MSSYLLSNENLSFIADSIVDLARADRMDNIAYPLQRLCIIPMYRDIVLNTPKTKEAKQKLFIRLKKFNMMALKERYGDDIDEEEAKTGYISLCNDYTVNYTQQKHFLNVLQGVIGCFLYQCCEGDLPDDEFYKAISKVQHNIDMKLLKLCYPDFNKFDGWAAVQDLHIEDNTNECIDIFDL